MHSPASQPATVRLHGLVTCMSAWMLVMRMKGLVCVHTIVDTTCIRGQMPLAMGVLEALQGVRKCHFVKIWF